MYFTEEEVKSILKNISNNFVNSEIIFEAISPFMAKNTKKHIDVKKYNASFKWGIKSGKEIESWNIKAKFINEYFYNRSLEKTPFIMRFFSKLPIFSKTMKIIHLKFDN